LNRLSQLLETPFITWQRFTTWLTDYHITKVNPYAVDARTALARNSIVNEALYTQTIYETRDGR